MKNYLLPFTVFLAAGLFLAKSCVQPPDYPIEPEIEFMSLSKNTLWQTRFGADSLTITFSFTDGDGDLGFSDTTASIFIVDGRDGFSKPSYRIPFVEQQGAGNGISGEVSIVVPTTCCIYPPNTRPPCDTSAGAPQFTDTVFYRIQIKDRAGNLSNEIETDPIILICKRQ